MGLRDARTSTSARPDLAAAFGVVAASLGGVPDGDAERAATAAHVLSLALDADPGGDLVALAGACGADPEGLADALGHVVDHVDDPGPLVALAAHLHPAGWWWTEPRAPFDDALLDALRAEARPVVTAGDAPVLATLCAADVVTDAVSRAVGRPLQPTLHAAFQFDEDLPVHLDREQFPYVLHVLLDGPATLLVHSPAGVSRVAARAGDGLVLAGRGTLHRWEPLAPGEHRTMIAIGYAASDS